jgi:hypothetical protein
MLLADLGLHSADESPAQEDPQHLAESTESPEHSALLFRSLYQNTLRPIRAPPTSELQLLHHHVKKKENPLFPEFHLDVERKGYRK